MVVQRAVPRHRRRQQVDHLPDQRIEIDVLRDDAPAAGVGQHLRHQVGGALRADDDRLRGAALSDSGGDWIASRSALPRMPVSRLLKSCATPPASTIRLSLFCCSCTRRSNA